jgi:hypothetical protein
MRKKLILCRETVRTLDSVALAEAAGGTYTAGLCASANTCAPQTTQCTSIGLRCTWQITAE